MHAKEALTALKLDRKRLKAEKFDLLNQMKQLYGTLEDKEKELRDFIRNYEQVYNISKENPSPPPLFATILGTKLFLVNITDTYSLRKVYLVNKVFPYQISKSRKGEILFNFP